ncbi:MAG: hypothetical protein L0Y44_07720 [Phycisphaerales bacterium]|nr:hypothetical protein [Phycisphaerales bacterium]
MQLQSKRPGAKGKVSHVKSVSADESLRQRVLDFFAELKAEDLELRAARARGTL